MHATKAAVEEGIVPGGGVALLRASKALDRLKLEGDQKVGVGDHPARHRRADALDRDQRRPRGLDRRGQGQGQARATRASTPRPTPYEDLVKAGVIDPAKVVRNALQNASSIASLLLTTEALVSEIPEEKKVSPSAAPRALRAAAAPTVPRIGSRRPIVGNSTCISPSSSSWRIASSNCLKRTSRSRATPKCSAGKRGIGGYFSGVPGVQRVADAELAGVHQADDVAGERALDRLALAAEEAIRPRRANLLAFARVGDHHVLLEHARADAHERRRGRDALVHVRLDLEDEAAEVGVGRDRRRDRCRAASAAAPARSALAGTARRRSSSARCRRTPASGARRGTRRGRTAGAAPVLERRSRRRSSCHASSPISSSAARVDPPRHRHRRRMRCVAVRDRRAPAAAADRRRPEAIAAPIGQFIGTACRCRARARSRRAGRADRGSADRAC